MTDESAKVILTRRRWDSLLLPLFIVAGILGNLFVWQSNRLLFAAAPIGILSIWAILRILTPRDGISTTKIRHTPGVVMLLGSIAATLVLFAVTLAIDIYVLGHPFSSPLEPYHALLFAPPFFVMITGAVLVGRIQKSTRAETTEEDDAQ